MGPKVLLFCQRSFFSFLGGVTGCSVDPALCVAPGCVAFFHVAGLCNFLFCGWTAFAQIFFLGFQYVGEFAQFFRFCRGGRFCCGISF